MAGQTVVSRRSATSSNAAGGRDVESHGGKGRLSPIKKSPFKRKKTMSSLATKFLLFGFVLSCCMFLTDIHPFGGVQVETSSNSTTPAAKSQLNLRPAYLTDDGRGDASADSEEEATTQAAEEEEAEEEEEEEVEEEKEAEEEVIGQHHYKIPRTLIFTHYKNLLELGERALTDMHAAAVDNTNTNHSWIPDQLEEWTLAWNVMHSIQIHNTTTTKVIFWTDADCIASLKRTRPKLVPYFIKEPQGMYKADMCRGTALLEHGGFYLDVDVGVRHDLWQDLKPTTQFVTARVHQASNWVGRGFFQAILGAEPKSPVMERYLELFEHHYDGTNKVERGPLGVLLLYRAWKDTKSKGVSTELYQELLYQKDGILDKGANKGKLRPAPTWGTRRACHFVVAGVANHAQNAELSLDNSDGTPIPLQIPALSRIPGSRMCSSTAEGSIEAMKWWERTS